MSHYPVEVRKTEKNRGMTKKDMIIEIKNSIEHHLDTKSDLKFKSFEGYDDRTGVLKVDCYGHHVSGSYIHDWEVAPKYVEDLQYTSNRVVEWFPKRSSSNGFGSDIYHFLVYTHKVFNKGKYKPKGRLLRVENCYIAFDYLMGHEWASLYILYKAIINKTLPDGIGIELKRERGKDIICIDGNQVAIVVVYEEEKWHHFKGHGTDTNRKRVH